MCRIPLSLSRPVRCGDKMEAKYLCNSYTGSGVVLGGGGRDGEMCVDSERDLVLCQ